MSNSSQRGPASPEILFARAVSDLLRKCKQIEWDDLLADLRGVENEALTQITGDATSSLEIRRRIAEAIYLAASIKNRDWSTRLQLFADLQELGFSTAESKYNFYLLFVRDCESCGAAEIGLQTLEELLALLRSSDHSIPEACMRPVEQLIKKMRGKLP